MQSKIREKFILEALDGDVGFAFSFSTFHSFLYDENTPKTIVGLANYDTDIDGFLIDFQKITNKSYTGHPSIKRGWCFYSKYPRITADDEFNEEFNKNRKDLIKELKEFQNKNNQ